ncbi:MAG: 30S ribosomal protein S4 [Bacteroidia bacterium]|nr:30S ribosomal protein S4 [Bacteroidia bacterium]MDW8302379.1 30S ribosomal protein S4 [Bacteroidia bacterium]
MARYIGPTSKIARRFREPIFGPDKSLERKNYPPGQHGRTRKTKPSEYAAQLAEKQKAKYTYGLLERQFRNLYKRASRKKGIKGENLLKLLEARLDNTVFRMGFAPTRRAARQLVTHKHVCVNGEVVNIPSYTLKPGDVVEIREKSKALEVVNTSIKQSGNKRFPWLDVDKANYKGIFLTYPERADIPEKINEQLIVELYSK